MAAARLQRRTAGPGEGQGGVPCWPRTWALGTLYPRALGRPWQLVNLG